MNTQAIKLGRIIPAVILFAVVAAVFLSYYQRSLSLRSATDRGQRLLPENISAATEGFSFLQSEQGRTRFEIKAKVNLGFKDSKNLLEAVTVKVFGKDGNRYDTITSDHCEYDQTKEEIVFSGNVVITLSQAGGEKPERKVDSIPNDKVTTIQVEKITYLKATGIAQTEDLVTFSRDGVHGTSRGLTYDTNRESIRLRSAVEILVQPRDNGEPQTELRCGTLDYFKASQRIDMYSNVLLQRGDASLEADAVKVWLHESDSSVSRAEALGRVRSASRDPRIMLQVNAGEVSYFFDATGRWLERVAARREVKSHSLDPCAKRDLSAQEMDIFLRPNSNLPESLHSRGNVVLVLADYEGRPASTRDPAVAEAKRDPRFDGTSEPGDRRVKAPEMYVAFHNDGKQLSSVRTAGQSTLEEFPWEPGDDKTVLTSLAFQLTFGRRSQVEKFTADQSVRVDIVPRSLPVKTTTSDHLEGFVDPLTRRVSELHQFGNFHYRERDQQAFAADARYFAQNRRTVLRGNARVRDHKGRTSADVIEFERLENQVKARGNVRSVFENQGEERQTGMFEGNSPVYASAESLEVQTASGIATYRQKARLWQDDQVLRADTIVLYRNQKRLEAEKNVTSLFYVEEAASRGGNERKERKPVTVRAERLVYEDSAQKATYFGNARMNSPMGTLVSNQLEVFLSTAGNKKSIERMLATGSVKISQPGKLATSEVAEFFQRENIAILTGGMPRVLDSERGSTSGARLTLFFDDGSISVVGNPETRSITRQRVAR